MHSPTRPLVIRIRQSIMVLAVLALAFAGTSASAQMASVDRALFDAAAKGDLAAVQASLADGADVNAANRRGLTAADVAVDKGHFKIAHFLLSVRNVAKRNKQMESAQQPVPEPIAPPPVVAQPVPVAPAPQLAPVPPAPPLTGPDPFDPNRTVTTTLPQVQVPITPTKPTPVSQSAPTVAPPQPVQASIPVAEPEPVAQTAPTHVAKSVSEQTLATPAPPPPVEMPMAQDRPGSTTSSVQSEALALAPASSSSDAMPEETPQALSGTVTTAGPEPDAPGFLDRVVRFLTAKPEPAPSDIPPAAAVPEPMDVTEAVTEVATPPATAPVVEPVAEIVSEPIAAPAAEIATDPKAEPIVKAELAPVTEPEVVTKTESEPVATTTPPTPEALPTPEPSVANQLAPEPAPRTVAEEIAMTPEKPAAQPSPGFLDKLANFLKQPPEPAPSELPSSSTPPVPETVAQAVVEPPLQTPPPVQELTPAPVTANAPAPEPQAIQEPTPTPEPKPEIVVQARPVQAQPAPVQAPTPKAPEVEKPAAPDSPSALDRFFGRMATFFSTGDPDKLAPSEPAPVTEPADQTPAPAQVAPKPTPDERRVIKRPLRIGEEGRLGRPAPPIEFGVRLPCVKKRHETILVCVEDVSWPESVRRHFAVESVLYKGFKQITRYNQGRAAFIHTLFPSHSFSDVVAHFTGIYGEPTETWTRSIAPLGEPRRPNPVMVWFGYDNITNQPVYLEVRQYDDARADFPDTQRGAVLLHYEDATPIFPLVSKIELMRIR